MKFEFNTDKYTFSTGKAPKGRGYWFFQYKDEMFRIYGTYSEAKKACIEAVKAIASEDTITAMINVMP